MRELALRTRCLDSREPALKESGTRADLREAGNGLGRQQERLGRTFQEAKSFYDVAKGSEPAGWTDLFGRPFYPQPPQRYESDWEPTPDEIRVALGQMTLQQRVAIFRQNRRL
jgi:hypothetical protein